MPGHLTLHDLTRLPQITVACTRCDRHGRYDTARLAEACGGDTPVPAWLREISAGCPRRDAVSVYDLCGVYFPGLAEALASHR